MKIDDASKEFLDRVTVRLMADDERDDFDRLLVEEHYLHGSRIGGRHLRYVAEVDGRKVALLMFSGAAPHLKGREQWIGWSPRQRARRLGLVVNNSRFLLLVERDRHPNLASKILGLVLRRLACDWRERWRHSVLVVESFVDESRYRGTCYRAYGFEGVGASAGFSRDARDYYTAHGQPKQLYLKELEKGARKLLCRPRLPEALRDAEADIAGPCPLRAAALGSLYERFRALDDPRSGHGLQHRAASTLACAALATLMGAGRFQGHQGYEDVCKRLPPASCAPALPLRRKERPLCRTERLDLLPGAGPHRSGPLRGHRGRMAAGAGNRPARAHRRGRQGAARHRARRRQTHCAALGRHPPSAHHRALRAKRSPTTPRASPGTRTPTPRCSKSSSATGTPSSTAPTACAT